MNLKIEKRCFHKIFKLNMMYFLIYFSNVKYKIKHLNGFKVLIHHLCLIILVYSKTNRHFLHAAVRGKCIRVCEWLIQTHPILLSVMDYSKQYPIHTAIEVKNWGLVRMFVLNRPNSIFFENDKKLTPFQLAIHLGEPDIIKFFWV